jgi:hypothetical protein
VQQSNENQGNESQGNPAPTEREQEEATTRRKQEHDAMQGAGHEDPQPPAGTGEAEGE